MGKKAIFFFICIFLVSCQNMIYENTDIPITITQKSSQFITVEETPNSTFTHTPTAFPIQTATITLTPPPIEILPIGQLELVHQLGRGKINKFSVSPSGDALVVASTIGVWIYRLPNGDLLDFQEGNPIVTIPHSEVADIVWSPDGKNVAVSNEMHGVWIWDTSNWELLTERYDSEAWEQTRSRSFSGFTWSPDSTELALDTISNGVWIWERNSNQWEKHESKISEKDLSLYSRSHNGILWNEDDGLQLLLYDQLFSVETGDFIRSMYTYIDGIGRVLWSPLKTHIYFLFDLGGGLIDNRTDEHLFGCCNVFSWSNDGHYLAMASPWGAEHSVYIYDLLTNKLTQEIDIGRIYGPVGWTNNNDLLITVENEGKVYLWNETQNELFLNLNEHIPYTLLSKDEGFEVVSIHEWLPEDVSLDVYDLLTGKYKQNYLMSIDLFRKQSQTYPYNNINYSYQIDNKNNQIIFSPSSSDDEEYILPYNSSIYPERNSSYLKRIIDAIAFAPDNNFLAAGNRDGDIIFWRLEDNMIIGVFKAHIGGISTLYWDKDSGNLISGSSDGTIKIWKFFY